MTVEEVLSLLEKVAPLKLSDDFCAKYKMYDNSGIIINCGNEVSGILFSLDLSEAAVKNAITLGYNLIVTHHPAIYGGISRFDMKNCAQARALGDCIKAGISVISMHLNFDVAPNGIDYNLACGIGGKEFKTLCSIEGGAYGRVYAVNPKPLDKLIEEMKKTFSSSRIVVHGESADSKKIISKVASFCGAGCDDNSIAFAKALHADAFVSSDLKHHEITELVESGVTVIEFTHYSAESYGFKCIYQNICKNLKAPSKFFFDERFA